MFDDDTFLKRGVKKTNFFKLNCCVLLEMELLEHVSQAQLRPCQTSMMES